MPAPSPEPGAAHSPESSPLPDGQGGIALSQARVLNGDAVEFTYPLGDDHCKSAFCRPSFLHSLVALLATVCCFGRVGALGAVAHLHCLPAVGRLAQILVVALALVLVRMLLELVSCCFRPWCCSLRGICSSSNGTRLGLF